MNNTYLIELINSKLIAAQESYAAMLEKYFEAIPATASAEENDALKGLFKTLEEAVISVQEKIMQMNFSPDTDKTQLQ